jgi:hypothetical protein
MKEKHTCCGRKGTGITAVLYHATFPGTGKCDFNATYFEDGRWWCGKHAPSKVEERDQKSLQKKLVRIKKAKEAEAEWDRRMEAHKKELKKERDNDK